MEKWKVEHWDDSDYVITIDDYVIGGVLTKRRAESILDWIKGTDLKRGFEEKEEED